MNVVFRVDAALHIGSGHVMRCLTLADELAHQGVNCIFICREFEGNLLALIKEKGYRLFSLCAIKTILSPKDNQIVPHEHWLGTDYESDAKQTIDIIKYLPIKIDWLIVDHYAIDIRWEQILRPYVNKIMLIDDLADRRHDCDLLLDQTFGVTIANYQSLVKHSTTLLLGSKYALLRDEFLMHRKKSLAYFDTAFLNDNSTRIFISLGGVDKDNYTGRILTCLQQICLSSVDEIHVVLGKNSLWLEDVKEKLKQLNCLCFCHHNINNVAEIMSRCNLAIGAGGTTVWERCALGIPSIVISMADNQDMIAINLAKYGSHWFAGKSPLESNSTLISIINHALFDQYALYNLSVISRNLCDAKGPRRVVRALCTDIIHFIPATMQDAELLYEWRNHPIIRSSSFNSDEINYDSHVQWMSNKLKASNVKILIIVNKHDEKIGCLRLDNIGNTAEVSIYLSPHQFANGYGSIVLEYLPTWIKQNCNQIDYIKAQIKEENEASKAIFKQAGYQLVSSNYLLKL